MRTLKRFPTGTPPDSPIPPKTGITGNKPPLYLGRSLKPGGRSILFTGEGSLLTIGPPGTGKSRGVAVWNLLNYPGSLLVTDPKGQLALWSAQIRERMGQGVAVFDPFGLTGRPSVSVNPLAAALAAVQKGYGYRAEIDRVAHMLLPDIAGADPYWRANARKYLITGFLYLAVFEPDRCDLPRLHNVLWRGNDEFTVTVLNPMVNSDLLSGALRQYAENVADQMKNIPKNFESFRDEARNALSIFAPDEPCGQACRVSNIDLSALLTGKLTAYLVLPPEYVASHGRWMGLVVSHAIQSIMHARGKGDCVFMLDEFANLGRLPDICGAIAQLREKGLRVWTMVQELSQIESVYGKPEMEAMRYQAEVLQMLGGCNTTEMAQFIETRAGTRTERVKNYSYNNPLDETAGPGFGYRDEIIPILPAAQAMNLPKSRQILVRRNYPVIVAGINLWRGN